MNTGPIPCHEFQFTSTDGLRIACARWDSRRTCALFLNAKAAMAAAPKVASLMAHEFEYDSDWELKQLAAFERVASHFSIDTAVGPGGS
jgi:hypothetical protein